MFPQRAYTSLAISLQQEWKFVQRITTGVGPLFAPPKAAFRDDFLP